MNKFLRKLVESVPLSEAKTHSVATDPVQQFMFEVKFDNFTLNGITIKNDNGKDLTFTTGFQKVSGLSVEMNPVEYHEGCSNYAKKLAGKAKFPDVTLEKGCVNYKSILMRNDLEEDPEDDKISLYGKEFSTMDFLTFIASASTARFDTTVSILGRDGKPRVGYKLCSGFFSKWEGPDLDASSDDVAIEKCTLSYDYWEHVKGHTAETDPWTPTSDVRV